jgi:subtilisin
MARYVMATRRANHAWKRETAQPHPAFEAALSELEGHIEVLEERGLRRSMILFEADPAEILSRRAALPAEVILEPEILHYPAIACVPDFFDLAASGLHNAQPAGQGMRIDVQVIGSGRRLPHARVSLFLRNSSGAQTVVRAETDSSGAAALEFGWPWQPSTIIAMPYSDHWPMVLRGPRRIETIDCPPLPHSALLWWHDRVGITGIHGTRGGGTSVGVVDTGCGPHRQLDHVQDLGAFVGAGTSSDGRDIDCHGSHVCGLIGARPRATTDLQGVAPAATLFSVRVFDSIAGGANQLDIAAAIDALSIDHEVDLINLSLGASVASAIEQDAIQSALALGSLCICAAGNSAGSVQYPAAFPESVAVSAVGIEGWGPHGSLATWRLPTEPARFGVAGFFLANFSCYGDEISVAAPGVELVSTVPSRHGWLEPRAAMAGTSMAAPIVTGVLAALLAEDSHYLAMPRNGARSAHARDVLKRAARGIGLETRYEGWGIPRLY